MIKSLFIKNFTLIDQLEILFNKGLNVLTGETGAGKSILIDAIDLAFGARASKDQIKTGSDKALLELHIKLSSEFPRFLLDENGIEVEDNEILVISREILQNSTRSRINGVLVTQNYVQNLREYLIDIHSQHETYAYIRPKTHIDLLDSYGDNNHQKLLQDFLKIYSEYRQIQKELGLAKEHADSKEQRIDFLRFQIDEISEAKINNPEEYENLVHERSVLLNAEDLKTLAYWGYKALYKQDNSIIDILDQLESKLIKASRLDSDLSQIAEIVASNAINLKDVSDQLINYSENLETNPEKLEMIEERINILDKLRRKYGSKLPDILDNLNKFEQELTEIELNSEKIDKLSEELTILESKLKKSSQELSNSRKKLAQLLSNIIQQELIKLEMPKVKFHIKTDETQEISGKGINNVEFMISTNPGEPVKPLAKIASGGEVSRVILAIKTIFAKADRINTVIFDEIDTGISGKTSQAVAEELANLSKSHQVLCITHQPIIAAMADEYFYIEKEQSENITGIKVSNLDKQQRIAALSRLASGTESKDSLNFAAKLIQQAEIFKNK